MNKRAVTQLDMIQAAVLMEKLKIFDEEIVARNVAARRYSEALRSGEMP